jgi:hypothetical protein
MNHDQLPTPQELAENPELTALTILDLALDLAVRALLAARPELCQDHFPRTAIQEDLLAERLMSHAFKLQAVLARYQHAVDKVRLDALESQGEEDDNGLM